MPALKAELLRRRFCRAMRPTCFQPLKQMWDKDCILESLKALAVLQDKASNSKGRRSRTNQQSCGEALGRPKLAGSNGSMLCPRKHNTPHGAIQHSSSSRHIFRSKQPVASYLDSKPATPANDKPCKHNCREVAALPALKSM